LQAEDKLNVGDEVAIFDGNYCVGAATMGQEDFVIVSTAMDDPSTEIRDGYISGHSISAKVWSAATGEEMSTELSYLEGDQNFEALGTFIGKLEKIVTEVPDNANDALRLRVIPNPFSDEFNLWINLPAAGKIEVEIFDLTGQKVKHLSQLNVNQGMCNIAVSDLNVEPGTYLLSVIYNNEDAVRRMSKKIIKK
jgi:hypothetical protein